MFCVASPAWALSAADEAYYTVESVQISEILEEEGREVPLVGLTLESGSPLEDLNEANVILDQILNMGKKIWAIIEANRPVVNHRTDVAHALPLGVASATQLENWAMPKAKLFRASYRNGFGSNVVDFKYRVIYTHGGQVNGKGAYLTNVTMIPAELNVAWGYTFQADGAVPSVVNVGSSQSPVAGMSLDMKWKVVTVVKHHEMTQSFFVQGDGVFVNLTHGRE
jgi:hypothetical protein